MPLRIGMVGSGFMAQQHSAGYHLLPILHPDVARVELVRIAGGRHVHAAAERYGWRESSDDWRAVTEADDIDVVDIVTPNDSHCELLLSAVANGKDVICEKPLARTYSESVTMRDAAIGVRSAVCFVYRTWPATRVAKEIIDSGRIGRVHGYRGRFLHDHFAEPRDASAWRFDPTRAGSGVVGDIGSHALDLARYLVGDVAEVRATTRGVLSNDVDDEADIDVRFDCGATGHLWLSWLATGTPMDVGFHVMGDQGSVRFTWTDPAAVQLFTPGQGGLTRIPLGPHHEAAAPYLPVTGIGMAYQQAFVPLFAQFLSGADHPTIDDGVVVAAYLDAVLASAASGLWTSA